MWCKLLWYSMVKFADNFWYRTVSVLLVCELLVHVPLFVVATCLVHYLLASL